MEGCRLFLNQALPCLAELFQDKLSKTEAQVVWKDYSPSHFCGATGTFNGIDDNISGVPAREKCEPASVGEFWCALPYPLPMKGLPSAMISLPPWGLPCPEGSPRPVSYVFSEEVGSTSLFLGCLQRRN